MRPAAPPPHRPHALVPLGAGADASSVVKVNEGKGRLAKGRGGPEAEAVSLAESSSCLVSLIGGDPVCRRHPTLKKTTMNQTLEPFYLLQNMKTVYK